jgi:hypothetical protein
MKIKTRYWTNEEGNNGIQYRNDDEMSPVWFSTNIGWLTIELEKDETRTAEQVAEDMAKGYKYNEVHQEHALWMAGYDEKGELRTDDESE